MDFKTGQDDGLQTGADFRDNKSGQEGLQIGADLGITKLAKGLQIGAKGLQIGAGITNRGKRDYKSGQGLQIGARITNRRSTTFTRVIGVFFPTARKILMNGNLA